MLELGEIYCAFQVPTAPFVLPIAVVSEIADSLGASLLPVIYALTRRDLVRQKALKVRQDKTFLIWGSSDCQRIQFPVGSCYIIIIINIVVHGTEEC